MALFTHATGLSLAPDGAVAPARPEGWSISTETNPYRVLARLLLLRRERLQREAWGLIAAPGPLVLILDGDAPADLLSAARRFLPDLRIWRSTAEGLCPLQDCDAAPYVDRVPDAPAPIPAPNPATPHGFPTDTAPTLRYTAGDADELGADALPPAFDDLDDPEAIRVTEEEITMLFEDGEQ